MTREFFGKPMRDISLQYHPDPQSIDEFVEEMKEGLDGYRENLKSHDFGKQDHHPERWVESFLAWYEVEQDADA